MKTAILFIVVITTTAFETQAAGGGGGGGGGGASGAAATAPAAPAQSAAPTTGASTPTTGQNQLGSATPNAIGAGASNNAAASNQFGMNSNRFQGSNNLAPTGAASGTNLPNRNFVRSDRATTRNDEALLDTCHERIRSILGITSSRAFLPMHLFVDNGTITLVGFVPTVGDRQRILLELQQIPGVAQVVDRLHVGTSPTEVQPLTATGEPQGAQGTQGTQPLMPAFNSSQVDHAFSPADQRVLAAVRQTADTQFGVNTANNGLNNAANTTANTTANTSAGDNTGNVVSTQLPVHFSVQNGVVSVMGTVVSQSQKLALLQALGRTAGVVSVVDDVQVGGASTTTIPQSTAPRSGAMTNQ